LAWLFLLYLSMTIPSKIEEDIWAGKCVYRTAQYGAGGQTILPIGNNQYGILYSGMSFSPAGGGITILSRQSTEAQLRQALLILLLEMLALWKRSRSLFIQATDFYPFVDNVPRKYRHLQ
jgi:hypothetical protein